MNHGFVFRSDVFVKDHNGQPIVGVVWPGNTAFPDFTSLNANLWWAKNLQDLQEKIHFDGVWIDMNEPSNFVHGSIKGTYGPVLQDVQQRLLYESRRHD